MGDDDAQQTGSMYDNYLVAYVTGYTDGGRRRGETAAQLCGDAVINRRRNANNASSFPK